MKTVLAVVLIVVILGGSIAFWSWFWFVYLPMSAVKEYEPDDGQELTISGTILYAMCFISGARVGYRLEHLYWVVHEDGTSLKVPVLVNLTKKQFKGRQSQFKIGERVQVKGRYLKRQFDNVVALDAYERADHIGVAIPEKKPRWDLGYFRLWTRGGSEKLVMVILVASDIQKI